MASMNELISEVTSLKHSSEELSEMLAYAGSNLQDNMRAIASLVSGSRTGMEAVSSLGIASKAILDSAASIKTLGRTCDDCVSQLSK